MNTTHLLDGPLIHRTSLVYSMDQDGWHVGYDQGRGHIKACLRMLTDKVCLLYSQNKVMLIGVWSHREIQGNENAHALGMERSGSPVLGPKPAISVPPCIWRL